MNSLAKGSRTQLDIGPLTACVVVDGKETELYGVEYNAADKQATCWIVSEAGKRFGVKWTTSDRSCYTRGGVEIDGQFCGANTLHSRTEPEGYKRSRWQLRDYSRISATKERKFEFATVQTTDDDAFLDQSISPNFGTIKLTIWEVQASGRVEPHSYPRSLQTLERVHEKSKKSLEHQMKLGEAISYHKKKPGMSTHRKRIRLLATFTFKYHSRALLQANGILPVERSERRPLSSNPPQDVIDLTLEADSAESDDDRTIQKLEERLAKLRQRRWAGTPTPTQVKQASSQS